MCSSSPALGLLKMGGGNVALSTVQVMHWGKYLAYELPETGQSQEAARTLSSSIANDLKMGRDRLVRPVRPPAGHRTGPVRSFGSGGHRTGVGPVEQAVQPDEPTGCAAARIPLQLQVQPATPRDLADGLQQRLSDTHKVPPAAQDTKRAPLQGIPLLQLQLQLQPATPMDLAGGLQQRHSQGPAARPPPLSPSW
ncbi:hypothetical protein CK203_053887 [Vitis vinifera]|uniref:Uncharacterized protein n=1 Tax=Vitis vinifera TaxID=29760 RepID=A0A438GSL8_VITVI|nr:hypothetical protein CK203_053887 [Vitis vinifera]